jgi:hypothetical protein
MSFADYLSQTFPGVRITSGRRDPNSALGRANPKSFHNVGKAWDTAPIPGMDFKQYVDRVGQDYEILEARDEVSNPSAHATGPHWHMAVGDRKARNVQPTGGLADLMNGIQPMALRTAGGAQGLAGLLPQNQPIQPMGQEQLMPMEPNIKKPGAFAQGGRGWEIMGIIGDALQTAGGGQATYGPAMMDIREQEEKGRQALALLMEQQKVKAQERQASLQDWRLKEDYQRENQGPTNAARMAIEAGYQPGTPQFKAAVQQYMQRPIMIGGEAYGYGSPQQDSGPQAVTLPNGTVAYNIGGEWYDNPEGR